MNLSRIMSSMDLSVYPQVGLVLFLAIFAVAIWRVSRTSRAEMLRCAAIPLTDEDDIVPKGADR